ncbi:hypothetical protein AWC38_SpisGene8161 [Stylophora pistillata]|uniref:Uncharacterized protein n=1 Tax=Stylophora pistillata TaxID=50429 RepID=A0A2B4S8Z2_STYPI|nr:hypothetical protein AWC38_SpisGene8161 [Stylophora pistillata]
MSRSREPNIDEDDDDEPKSPQFFSSMMILPKLALSYINESLESIARFADADTLQRIVNRVDLYLHDAEELLLDYETRDVVEKRNEIFKAVLEYTKFVVERELSDEKDGHECAHSMETERTERQERLRLEQEKKEQEYEDLLWKLHKDKPYEVFNPAQTHEESVAFWTLRLTLPRNDVSIKYYPENNPNSWKNRLSSFVVLDKDWKVGMSSISLPHESRLKKYLHITPDATRLLTTKRRVYVVLAQQLGVITTYVDLRDIKDKPLDTPHDLLKALFEVERERFILELGKAGVLANKIPTGKFPHLQFDVSFDDALEACTVSAEKIIPDTLSNNDVRDNVYFELRKDLCILLGWVQPKAWFNVVTVKNAENLAFTKRGSVWVETRSDQNIPKRYWSTEENGEMVKFYLHELVRTFINTKRSAYKRGHRHQEPFMCIPL